MESYFSLECLNWPWKDPNLYSSFQHTPSMPISRMSSGPKVAGNPRTKYEEHLVSYTYLCVYV